MNWPERLVEAIARRRAIVFLGAGASKHATPAAGGASLPDWPEFIEAGCVKLGAGTKHIKQYVSSGDLISACQLLKDKLGPNAWNDLVEDVFSQVRLQYGALHTNVFLLDLPIVMTSNVDRVYDTAALALSDATAAIKRYDNVDLGALARGNARARFVLKVHGTLDDVPNMIFTRTEYNRLRYDFPAFQRTMSALFATHVVLFVGCGFRDPDMLLLLEEYAHIYRGTGLHFGTFGGRVSADAASLYAQAYGLQIIPYSAANGHAELVSGMEELVALVQARREEMMESGAW